jgi:hypothetical protein
MEPNQRRGCLGLLLRPIAWIFDISGRTHNIWVWRLTAPVRYGLGIAWWIWAFIKNKEL